MNVYEIVTDRIIAEMEKGRIPWHKEWAGVRDGAWSYSTGKSYSFLNQLLLKHRDAYLTFKQVTAAGGRVKKGAKSEIVVFWKMYETTETGEDGTEKTRKIPVLRYYNVFWIGDCEGVPEKDRQPVEHELCTDAETIIADYVDREAPLKFINNQPSNSAYYSPLSDTVVVPMPEQFEHLESYYSTAFHELTHSTGAENRLNRLKTGASAAFGGEEYSKEELVAELGAAMLTHHCGLESEKSFKNSAAYLQSWLAALKNDKNMIVSAASRAEKAVNYILGA